MMHLGDITKINGSEIPAVDVITFVAPCQDISIAGRKKGMLHEANGDAETTRSGLFFEAIRVIKEMRARDVRDGRTGQFIRPRYMVWENVPGAFSSNKGKDFQAVLTEIVRIAEPEAPDVPMPDKDKWSKSGCLYDELGRWSIAWRVHDAQFWGVPQRRKRIALVADFGGCTAPEILFERKGLSGDFEQSGTPRESSAGSAETSVRGTSVNGGGAYQHHLTQTTTSDKEQEAESNEKPSSTPQSACKETGSTAPILQDVTDADGVGGGLHP